MPVAYVGGAYKRPQISYTWSGSVRGPFVATNWGNGANIGVSGGVATENGVGGPNGNYYTGVCYQDPLGTSLHYAEVTNSNVTGANQPRGVGALVGGNGSVPTSGVFALGAIFSGSDSTTIYSLSGTTATTRAQGTTTWGLNDKLRIQITHNGTNYIQCIRMVPVQGFPGLIPGILLLLGFG